MADGSPSCLCNDGLLRVGSGNNQAGIKGGLPTGGGLPAVTLISDNDFLKSGFW
jgi:hypothetical protein